MVIGAIDAGKHVVCEKPLATNSVETSELVERARKNPTLVTAVNYNVRFYPLALHARAFAAKRRDRSRVTRKGRVHAGLAAEGYRLELAIARGGGGQTASRRRHRDPLDGSDPFHNRFANRFGFCRSGDPHSDPAATEGSRCNFPRERRTTGRAGAGAYREPIRIETEDWGSVLFRFANGARGTMCVSQVTAGRKNQITFEIAGSEGSLAWDSEHPNDLWLGHRDKPNELLDPGSLLARAQISALSPAIPAAITKVFRTPSSNFIERFMSISPRGISRVRKSSQDSRMVTRNCCSVKRYSKVTGPRLGFR